MAWNFFQNVNATKNLDCLLGNLKKTVWGFWLLYFLGTFSAKNLDRLKCQYFVDRNDDRQRPGEQNKNKLEKTRKTDIWLISFDGSSHSVLYGFFTRGPIKKHDDLRCIFGAPRWVIHILWRFLGFPGGNLDQRSRGHREG